MFELNIFVRLLTFLLIFDSVWCNIKMSRIFNIYIFSAERRAEMEMEIDSADTSQDIVPAPDVPDFQPVKEQFEKFSREAERRWAGDEQFRKAWTFFNKKMDKYFKGANSRLIRKLYDFGIENKRKNNPVMHVQPTSITRRRNKQKGRSVSRYGRRHKDTVRRTQVFEDENQGEDLVLHSIPGRIQRNRGVPHNMQEIVERNRRAAKKH